jgi:Na+(H+)/acetate symporter ActP
MSVATAALAVLAAGIAVLASGVEPVVLIAMGNGVVAGCLAPAVVAGLWIRSVSAAAVQAGVMAGLAATAGGAVAVGLVSAASGDLVGQAVLIAVPLSAVAASAGAVGWRSRRFPARSAGGQLRLHQPAGDSSSGYRPVA